jgi:exosome complex component CSL4
LSKVKRKESAKSKVEAVTPGESVSVIEAFDAGSSTFVDDGEVRALRVGRAEPDLKDRVIAVKPVKGMRRVPKPGDTVVGTVETAQPSVSNILIEEINDEYSQAGFTGMLQTRPDPRMRSRRRVTCKPGDVVRAHVYSVKNSIYHLSVDRPEDGVLYTICSQCGGNVVRVRDSVKCTECDYFEERKLASDFDQYQK